MGNFTTKTRTKLIAWAVAAVIIALNAALLISLI